MKDERIENYLNKLNKDEFTKEVILAIHDEAVKNNVPIVFDDTLDFLMMIIKLLKPKKILELGTAVGFSSIMMALNCDATIDTIERNIDMYNSAISNINKLKLENRIHVHYADALTISLDELENDYDLIFIDAAKAQNQKFFLKYSPLLSDGGLIITDNILFHGYVSEYNDTGTIENGSKDLKAMVKKISEYNKWLLTLEDFDTKFINIGDGLALSIKK